MNDQPQVSTFSPTTDIWRYHILPQLNASQDIEAVRLTCWAFHDLSNLSLEDKWAKIPELIKVNDLLKSLESKKVTLSRTAKEYRNLFLQARWFGIGAAANDKRWCGSLLEIGGRVILGSALPLTLVIEIGILALSGDPSKAMRVCGVLIMGNIILIALLTGLLILGAYLYTMAHSYTDPYDHLTQNKKEIANKNELERANHYYPDPNFKMGNLIHLQRLVRFGWLTPDEYAFRVVMTSVFQEYEVYKIDGQSLVKNQSMSDNQEAVYSIFCKGYCDIFDKESQIRYFEPTNRDQEWLSVASQ